MGLIGELFRCFLPSQDAFLFMWLLACLGCAAIAVTIERWRDIGRRTDYDAARLFDRIKRCIDDKRLEDAISLCSNAGMRALPRIIAAGIEKFKIEPFLVPQAMSEESTHACAAIERRLSYLVMFGNVSTLLGLLGTVYGLIMAFTAVGQPGVAAVEKSSLLAAGISTAMNSTLVGLSISIPCVVIYSLLRAKADAALQEMDRFAVATLKLLNPPALGRRTVTSLTRRSNGDEDVADTDVTPMLNLMVMLIPFLLTSSEFVKIGAIDLKLPESSQTAGGGGDLNSQAQEAKLDLGVVITAKGFTLFNYFKTDKDSASTVEGQAPDIPLVNGEYDYATLNTRLADVKKQTLGEILRTRFSNLPADATLYQLYNAFSTRLSGLADVFPDHENVKIVAEEAVRYETVVAVMDAARGIRTADGVVTMFPNVTIAGGVVR
jgi:biopolymer transport protein ExbB